MQSLAASLRSSQGGAGSESSGSFDWESPYEEERERCFLVGVQLKQQRSKHGYSVHESLEELSRLADTAGLEVTGSTYQLLDEVSVPSPQRAWEPAPPALGWRARGHRALWLPGTVALLVSQLRVHPCSVASHNLAPIP
jgi:hypothetical protein